MLTTARAVLRRSMLRQCIIAIRLSSGCGSDSYPQLPAAARDPESTPWARTAFHLPESYRFPPPRRIAGRYQFLPSFLVPFYQHLGYSFLRHCIRVRVYERLRTPKGAPFLRIDTPLQLSYLFPRRHLCLPRSITTPLSSAPAREALRFARPSPPPGCAPRSSRKFTSAAPASTKAARPPKPWSPAAASPISPAVAPTTASTPEPCVSPWSGSANASATSSFPSAPAASAASH